MEVCLFELKEVVNVHEDMKLLVTTYYQQSKYIRICTRIHFASDGPSETIGCMYSFDGARARVCKNGNQPEMNEFRIDLH